MEVKLEDHGSSALSIRAYTFPSASFYSVAEAFV
jgi:hypothetical protein